MFFGYHRYSYFMVGGSVFDAVALDMQGQGSNW